MFDQSTGKLYKVYFLLVLAMKRGSQQLHPNHGVSAGTVAAQDLSSAVFYLTDLSFIVPFFFKQVSVGCTPWAVKGCHTTLDHGRRFRRAEAAAMVHHHYRPACRLPQGVLGHPQC